MRSRMRVVQGGAVVQQPLASDPWEFQDECVEAFVASWRDRRFSPVTIGNDIGLLERTLKALGRPAWEVTADDVDRVVGDLAVAGRTASTRREYVRILRWKSFTAIARRPSESHWPKATRHNPVLTPRA